MIEAQGAEVVKVPGWYVFAGGILDECERELIAGFGAIPNQQTTLAFDLIAKIRKRMAEGILAAQDALAAEAYAARKAAGKKPCEEDEVAVDENGS